MRRVDGQKYCGAKECQRARKKAWRRNKYASDPDYRLNQQASTAEWLSKVGGAAQYYREYRKRKKLFASKRREEGKPALWQKPEDESLFAEISSGSDVSANRDAKKRKRQIKTGRYKMCLAGANRDAFWAEIRVITHS